MKNGKLWNEKAVSPVLGAVLMLAVGVTILTTMQLNFVPVWNAQEELDHMKKMYDDFKDLKSGIESGVQSGTTLSRPLTMGFKYSPKMFVYNPRESAFASLDIRSNTWAEVRYNEVLPDGMDDATAIRNLTSSTITYSLQGAQNYNAFIYEHGLIRRNGSNYTAGSQTVMANGTIYLLSLKPWGSEKTIGVEKRSVNIYPTSQQKNSVIGKNVWLILHTNPAYVTWWKSKIEKEGGEVKKADGGTVIAYADSMVIRMGEVYISPTASVENTPSHAPPYRLVKITPDNTYLPIDGTVNLGVEVQDYYNNPVPNVQVNFSINKTRTPGNANSSTAYLLQSYAISGADGRGSVSLKTGGSGIYYVDASVPANTTTFAYPASSQGGLLALSYTGSGPLYDITARVTDGVGNGVNGHTLLFDTSDGTLTSYQQSTGAGGYAYTTFDDTSSEKIRLTNIISSTTATTAGINWDTINNITFTAKSLNGYFFSSLNIPTRVNTSGCVLYGTSPGNYTGSVCDIAANTHSVNLTGLLPSTAYYFIVNSSRQPSGPDVYSTEYMFVTDKIGDDGVPPASISGLANSPGDIFITWTWTDPADVDFDHVEIYIDGVPEGTVNKGVKYFNATYFMPGTSHNISTRTVDMAGRVNASWVNQSASTTSAFTYVFGFQGATGAVTNPENARNPDGLYATLAEGMVGGTEQSNRPLSPSKNITNGTQGGGAYNPGDPDAPGSVDVTLLPQAFATKYAAADPVMALGSIQGGSFVDTLTSNDVRLNLREQGGGANTLNTQWNSWNSFTEAGSTSLTEMNIGIEGYGGGGEALYIKLWNFSTNDWNTSWNQVGTLPAAAPDSVLWYNITDPALIRGFVNPAGNFRIMLADAKNATGSADGTRSNFYIDEFKVVFKYFSDTLDVTYTFNGPGPGSAWQSISIKDSSYADSLADASIFNAAGSRWESILTGGFSGGTTPARHVNKIVGASGNASDYDSGSGQIRIKYNWTGATMNNTLGVDEMNVTVTYLSGGVYNLNVTANTTGIPETTNPGNHQLQTRYNVSGDNFTLAVWNGAVWNIRTTLNNQSLDYYNYTLLPGELLYDGAFTGNAGIIGRYYVLVRYVDVTANGVQGKLYLDYQRVYSW